MKKNIILFLFTTVLFGGKNLPENFNDETSELRYEEVVQVDSKDSKKILFDKLQRFIVMTYNSSNDVIQLNDKESGNIIVKGNSIFLTMGGFLEVWVPHTLDIRVKDGRYKYTLSSTHNINSKKPSVDYYYSKLKKMNKGWIIKSDESLQSLIIEMKNFVKNDSVNEEDW